MTDNPYPVGTTVFAKLKGYPWWPARSDQDLPANVSSKKPKQRPIWPVFFFGSYDYGWFGTSELKSFDPASAEKTRNAHKKGSALRTALSEALDPNLVPQLNTNSADLDDYDEDEEELEQEPARPVKKKAATLSKKKPSKSELASEKKRRPSATEDQTVKRKVTKRTSASDEDDEDQDSPKTKKRASMTARSRLESDMKSVEDDISIGDASNGRTRKSEEDAGDSGDHARAKKKIRSGQPNERLLKLRHKLQKLLLVEGLSDEVLVQNLDRADPILAEVEAFDIDLQMLKDTKIGRLMKKISALKFSQDQHKIVDRSVKLIKQYKSMMEKAQENGDAVSPTTEKAKDSSTPIVDSTCVVAALEPSVIGTEQGASEATKPEAGTTAPLANSNKLYAEPTAPAPEAVVAAVAAIVETNTLSPTPSSEVTGLATSTVEKASI
ncbi:hypothetical protein EC968_000946 [Mortierella alpina]|nr:hypothetical protein EC968_000946 [Mortierella alpina]